MDGAVRLSLRQLQAPRVTCILHLVKVLQCSTMFCGRHRCNDPADFPKIQENHGRAYYETHGLALFQVHTDEIDGLCAAVGTDAERSIMNTLSSATIQHNTEEVFNHTGTASSQSVNDSHIYQGTSYIIGHKQSVSEAQSDDRDVKSVTASLDMPSMDTKFVI